MMLQDEHVGNNFQLVSSAFVDFSSQNQFSFFGFVEFRDKCDVLHKVTDLLTSDGRPHPLAL